MTSRRSGRESVATDLFGWIVRCRDAGVFKVTFRAIRPGPAGILTCIAPMTRAAGKRTSTTLSLGASSPIGTALWAALNSKRPTRTDRAVKGRRVCSDRYRKLLDLLRPVSEPYGIVRFCWNDSLLPESFRLFPWLGTAGMSQLPPTGIGRC